MRIMATVMWILAFINFGMFYVAWIGTPNSKLAAGLMCLTVFLAVRESK